VFVCMRVCVCVYVCVCVCACACGCVRVVYAPVCLWFMCSYMCSVCVCISVCHTHEWVMSHISRYYDSISGVLFFQANTSFPPPSFIAAGVLSVYIYICIYLCKYICTGICIHSFSVPLPLLPPSLLRVHCVCTFIHTYSYVHVHV